MQNTHNLFFSEKRLVYVGKLPVKRMDLTNRSLELPKSLCKKADARYFSIIKKTGKLSAASFQKKFKKSTLPSQAKKAALKEMTKRKFLYPAQKDFDAKVVRVAKKLTELTAKDSKVSKIKSGDLENLRDEAQDGIKVVAETTAGFTTGGGANVNINTTRNAQFKGIISNMNGKVPKTQLLKVAKNYKKIATAGINIAIGRKMELPKKFRKHMTAALNA